MEPNKIYLDNMFLVQWALYKFFPRKHKRQPRIIEFLSHHKQIEKYISLVSIAELTRTLKYGDEFRKMKLDLKRIIQLIEEMQNIAGLKILLKDTFNNAKLNGIVISYEIIKFIDKHIIDCIHIDIAKSHELFFISNEKKIGRVKDIYKHVMTENKLMKQFK